MQGFKGKFVKGSEPESVYWKRRGIVAGVALALVLLVVILVSALGGGEGDGEAVEAKAEKTPHGEWVPPTPSATVQRPYIIETPTASPSEEPSPTEPEVLECPAEDLMLQVVAAFDEVRSGSKVPVSVLVASGADEDCTANLRSVAVELASGDDVVYSTAHCETPSGEEVELSGGEGQTIEFTVDGLASAEGCEGARRELPAGEYELRARLGEAFSSPTSLRLK